VKAKITELGKIDEERVKKKQEEELLEQMQKL
jgi:hypothetical protein